MPGKAAIVSQAAAIGADALAGIGRPGYTQLQGQPKPCGPRPLPTRTELNETAAMNAAPADAKVHRHRFPRWLRRVLVSVIAAAALLALLPQGIRLGLEYALHQQGLREARIADIDFNPFILDFRLRGLYGGDALSVEQLRLRLDWGPLWERRVRVRELELRGVRLAVAQQDGGSWRIGGIALPPSAQPAPAAPGPDWGVGLQHAHMEDAVFTLTLPALDTSLDVAALDLHDFHTWLPQQATELHLAGKLNGSDFKLQATATPLAAVIAAQARLTLQALAVAPFLALAPEGIPAVDARLTVASDFSYRGDAVEQRLTQKGSVGIGELALVQTPWRITGKGAQWDGDVDLTLHQGTVAALAVNGTATLDHVTAGDAGEEQALLTLAGVRIDGITLRGNNDIGVAELALDGVQLALRRDAGGQLRLPAAGDTSPAAKDETAPPALHIGRIVLGGDNAVEFIDQSVMPAYRETLHITAAEITGIDNRAPGKAASFHLTGRAGRYTALELRGEVLPFAARVNLKLHSELQALDLPHLTPYTIRYLGYNLSSGQLGATMRLAITDDMLEGNNDLRIHKLTVEQTDPEKMAHFNEQLKIPLDTALYMLKDKDDNIALKLPISGNLHDPSFDISDAINTALAKTMRLATVSYLKLLLQPFGGLLTLASLADGAGNIKLEPFTFLPGSAVLDPPQQAYLEKIGGLFQQRPKLQLRLCGYATAADRPEPPKGKPPLDEAAMTALLENLAHERAEAVKAALVTQHDVAPQQLFVCHPAIDAAAAAQPRVEPLL